MDITLLPSPPATPPLCEKQIENVSFKKISKKLGILYKIKDFFKEKLKKKNIQKILKNLNF